MRRTLLFMMLVLFVVGSPLAEAQKRKKKGKEEAAQPAPPKKSEYEKLTAAKNVIGEGFFKILKKDGKYYFEIPDAIREREFLLITRISGFVEGLKFGGAGMSPKPKNVIRWDKLDNKILMRSVSQQNIASEELPISKSIEYNNFQPILQSFDIKAYNADSTSVIIDVTNFFTSDIEIMSPLSANERRNFGIRNLDRSRSLITNMKAFPENLEVRHVLTYNGNRLPSNNSTGTLSVEMTESLVLLPEVPMQARYHDNRVGFFSIQKVDYGSEEQRAQARRIITRWRLEPSDWAAYNRGELVDPVKPIVYYIDPATPERFRKYLKLGIEDWQSAFEKIGFKNAIIAKDPPSPEEDPDWSPEDVRYSVARYITTSIVNAQGPHVHDPRSGEIIESDILWYHNVISWLRTMTMIQTGAINPKARKAKLDDEDLGMMVRYVMAHEVGHTLGFPHNMGASYAYHVDSLRSPSFTKKWGLTASIMDYARMNYVAQPGDGDVHLANNKIGPYDDFAVKYGYKPIQNATASEEVATLNQWIEEVADDPMYRYGPQTSSFGHPDPTSQTEDLGHNSAQASAYGLANLERIMPNLVDWTREEGVDYISLQEAYNGAMSQWFNYLRHTTHNIGGVSHRYKKSGEEGNIYSFISRERQKEAMNLLLSDFYHVKDWLLDENILRKLEMAGVISRIQNYQNLGLNMLLNEGKMARLIEFELFHGKDAYTLNEMMTDLRKGIWEELPSRKNIDMFRRNLQKSYLSRLEHFMSDDYNQPNASVNSQLFSGQTPISTVNSDIKSNIFGQLTELRSDIKRALGGAINSETKYHLMECLRRIDATLDTE